MKQLYDIIVKITSLITRNQFHPGGYWGTEMRFMLGSYERESVKICKQYIKPGMHVLDIGGDIGYYSKLFSRLIRNTGKVYVFEPHPEIFTLLLKNIKHGPYKNVYPINMAVGKKVGQSKLFTMKSHGRHSLYDVSKYDDRFKVAGKIPVAVTAIDDFLAKEGSPSIDFFKIDIEGGEIDALLGMRKTIEKNNALAGIIEFNAKALLAAGQDSLGFIDHLKNMGFSVWEISSNGTLKAVDQETYIAAEALSVNLFVQKR